MGVAVGQTKDKANFDTNAGFLKTSNNTATMYGTWLYSEHVSIDGYLGYGKLSLDNQRQFAFGPQILGTMTSNTNGRQTMAGMSVSYQMDAGRFNLAPSLNLDYVKTSINSYSESGSNVNTSLIALHYGDRRVTSLTSSLGGRLSTSYGYDWGAFQPSARLAAVHEFQNRTRQISNALVLAPSTPFVVETDAPDRNYLNIGLGVSAALNSGTQLFLDYDKRAQDKLLSSWAVSLGVLTEF
jgi:outer membrane autotransporter protein